MMSKHRAHDSMPRHQRILYEGNTLFCHGEQGYLNGYVKFLCGGTKEAPAKLEFYADINSSTIQKILFFADVEKVEYTEDQMKSYITITMKDNGNGMTFCADSSEATKEWFWCCLTLKAIPYYPIPEFPTENLTSEKLINQHCDSKRFGADTVWVVNILPDGIGSTVNLVGLYVLALYYHDHKLTIHEIKTGKRLLEWDGDKIRRAGYIKSLAFVEAGAMCHGGPGLIWIQYCHCRQLYEYFDRFLRLKPKAAPPFFTPVVRSSHSSGDCSGEVLPEDPENFSRDCSWQIDSHNDCNADKSSKEVGDGSASKPTLPPRAPYANLNVKKEKQSNPENWRSRNKAGKVISHSIVSRKVYEGQVHFIYGENPSKKGYIEIYCTGLAGHPARIEVFNDKKTANKGKSFLHQIFFANIKSVVATEIQGRPYTNITTQEGVKCMFSSSVENNKRLLGYCKVMHELPGHVIPEVPPNCHLVVQQHAKKLQYRNFAKYGATSDIWVVYLISEGIGEMLDLIGPHVVTIQATNIYKMSSTFNVYSSSGNHRLAWELCKIERSGYFDSLVFLEVDKKTQGGPGVLWMYFHPNHLGQQFTQLMSQWCKILANKCGNVSQSGHKADLGNHSENSLASDTTVQDNPSIHEQESFRSRRSAMSSTQAQIYKPLGLKKTFRPRKSAMSSAQAEHMWSEYCKSKTSRSISNTKNVTSSHDCINRSNQDNHVAEMQTTGSNETVSTPIPVSSCHEEKMIMTGQLDGQMTAESIECSSYSALQDESSQVIAQCTECTSPFIYGPLQDKSSHALIGENLLLHHSDLCLTNLD